MEELNFLLGFFNIIGSLLGIVLYTLGHKLIRIIYLFLGITFGFMLGYLIGFVINSSLLSFINGITLSIVFGFFNFFHYQYLKGVSLGILSLGLCFYFALILMGTVGFTSIIAVSIVISMVLAMINYKYEKMTTMLVTAWLGAILIIHNIFGLLININFSWLTAIIGLFVGVLGFCLQYFVICKRFPKQI